MARLLFLENREKTYFWAAIARRLQAQGHQIAWIVQNPVFGKGLPGTATMIPFPEACDLVPDVAVCDYPALVTDRGREHFGAGSAHYPYYADRVAAAIDAVSPDVVIGEPTLFHELIAVDHCRRRGIVFAHPVGERYPPNRFTIFDGDSQRPLLASGETLAAAAALALATDIRDGRALPTYMATGGALQRRLRRLHWAATRARVVLGRWRGERFNTPSVRTKRMLEQRKAHNLARWAAIARRPADPSGTLLYPLQMQPENTIDVWGRPDHDQAGIVRRLMESGDRRIAVKGNPKPYYEVSNDLLALAGETDRVVLLPLDMRMPEAMALTAGAVTVTGTVGYEAVCGRGRCISTAHPILDDYFPRFVASSVEAAAQRLIDEPSAGVGSAEDGARLLQRLTERSFPGTISDPISDPHSMSDDNIAAVTAGLSFMLASIPAGPRA